MKKDIIAIRIIMDWSSFNTIYIFNHSNDLRRNWNCVYKWTNEYSIEYNPLVYMYLNKTTQNREREKGKINKCHAV